ncbi:hypothetical protein HNP89_001079 [Methanococcus maripaludis]|uniref:DUF7982 domain-containing protein n=1 Tax=Methanococcus maripaludis TaxID=39152 RepID=A0A7J9NZJ1_METMI|nr:hypothetical protein [Methanococcus maripaludis]MBA2853122.1 hypothetical protein [Methanococcus maripaludis]
MIDYSVHEALNASNNEFLKKIFENLNLCGKPIYLPPYENLENGGIFIPSSKKFTLNLSAFTENSIFLANKNASSEMGVLINPPIGLGLLKKFEENFGESILKIDTNTAFSLIQSSLSSMDLFSDIDFEEKNGKLSVKIYKNKEIESFEEFYYLSPVISSIFLALSKSMDVPVIIEEFLESDEYMEFTAAKYKLGEY